jgi:hypothetical protein
MHDNSKKYGLTFSGFTDDDSLALEGWQEFQLVEGGGGKGDRDLDSVRTNYRHSSSGRHGKQIHYIQRQSVVSNIPF